MGSLPGSFETSKEAIRKSMPSKVCTLMHLVEYFGVISAYTTPVLPCGQQEQLTLDYDTHGTSIANRSRWGVSVLGKLENETKIAGWCGC